MESKVGYLIPAQEGYRVICTSCKNATTMYSHLETPVFVVNLGQYKQHCTRCGKDLNPNSNPKFPELFEGK
jgi:ribosomal protein S27E